MTTEVTLKMVYKELKDLRNELETVKFALIPEEKVSDSELAAIRAIKAEMKARTRKNN